LFVVLNFVVPDEVASMTGLLLAVLPGSIWASPLMAVAAPVTGRTHIASVRKVIVVLAGSTIHVPANRDGSPAAGPVDIFCSYLYAARTIAALRIDRASPYR
jgi:hypothetical protein